MFQAQGVDVRDIQDVEDMIRGGELMTIVWDEDIIKKYMALQLLLDPETFLDRVDEVNMTKLAEDAADAYNLYVGDNCDIPEEVFELAFEVGEEYLKSSLAEIRT